VSHLRFIGIIFIVLLLLVLVIALEEIRKFRSIDRTADEIIETNLPKVLADQKLLLDIERLRRLAELVYITSDQAAMRTAGSDVQRIVSEAVNHPTLILVTDGMRLARHIDHIVELRMSLERQEQKIQDLSRDYIGHLFTITSFLADRRDKTVAYSFFLKYFVVAQEDISTASLTAISGDIQKYLVEMRAICDKAEEDLPSNSRSALETAMRYVDENLRELLAVLREKEQMHTDMEFLFAEVELFLNSIQERINIETQVYLKDGIDQIHETSEIAKVSSYSLFAILVFVLIVDFFLLYFFVNKPLLRACGKLKDIQNDTENDIIVRLFPETLVGEIAGILGFANQFKAKQEKAQINKSIVDEEEEAIRDQKAILEAVFASEVDGYIVWGANKVLMVSPFVLHFLGISKLEDFSLNYQQYGFGELSFSQASAKLDEGVCQEEIFLKDKDEELVPTRLTYLSIVFKGEKCLLICIRVLKGHKDNLLPMGPKEELGARGEKREEILGNVSQKLMTPLSCIMDNLQVLLGTELTLSQRIQLERASDDGRVMVTMLNNLINYSAQEEENLELATGEFSLEVLLKRVLDANAVSAQSKALELFMNVPPLRHSLLLGNELLLMKILNKLVNNAIKFTDKGFVSLNATALFTDNDSLGKVTILFTVKDSGVGLSEMDKTKLFADYGNIDSSFVRKLGGPGEGLSFAKKKVESLGGRLWCESSPKLGSSFHFTVKLMVVSGGVELPDSEKIFKGATALVLAPPTEGREALFDMLMHFYLNPIVVESHMEALDFLGKEKRNVFIFIDERIEGLLHFLLDLLEQYPETDFPVIYMVSQSSTPELNLDLVNSILEKPFSPETLFNALVQARESADTKV
jgi:signal transduction histidine kinase